MRNIVVVCALMLALGGCGGRKQAVQEKERGVVAVNVMDTVASASDDSKDTLVAQEEAVEEADVDYVSGDTLCVYDGKTVIYDMDIANDDMQSMGFTEIKTYVGNKLISACLVKCFTNYVESDGKILKAVIGVDTVRYRLASLPRSIDPVRKLAGAGMKNHTVRNSFAVNAEEGWKCKFYMTAWLPEDRPGYIGRMLAAQLYTDTERVFAELGRRLDAMTEYSQLEKNPERYKALNVETATPEEIGRYFAKRYERLYKKYFVEEIEEGWGPPEEYLLEVAPVWSNDDGRYTTYRFYTYHYGGGAHGMMYEYYMTFDNESGRVLGYRDILGYDGMKSALVMLRKKLNDRLGQDRNVEGGFDTDFGDVGSDAEDMYNVGWLEEVFEGKIYPRPAVTREGIVFTYQPYDKGSFADGILHFALPIESKLTVAP